VTAEDLLFLAVSHARSGDLLRAEQYLSAARQRGHEEATVVYWLVRVCVAASRYLAITLQTGLFDLSSRPFTRSWEMWIALSRSWSVS
jgi:hypothetical protein